MKLYIAEKPSLGRAIADVLPKPHTREDGCIRVGNGDYVSWCIGHLLALAEPQAYDAAFQHWRLEHLPIIPASWQVQAKPKTKKQLAVLRKLTRLADEIVHAGDPDREGQLLVDEVIAHLSITGVKRDQMQRCLINDLNPQAVSRALDTLRSNQEFVPLATSALARSRADWLYGMNMTRAYTLAGRKVGYDGLLSVGRVQTPVLGLVVRRDLEIADFSSKAFYEVLAHIRHIEGTVPACQFAARWQPSEACASYMDENAHVLSKKLAENVVSRIAGQLATVTSASRKHKRQTPPLPYSLSGLQIDAARRFSMNAKQVLDICQTLYERHKLITYPRSDSRYLPGGHFKEAAEVLGSIRHNLPACADAVDRADSKLKSKAWNDARAPVHHAIIPTRKQLSCARLSMPEQQVYELIARQYIVQFYPPHEYVENQIELEIAAGIFTAKSRKTKAEGWKLLFFKDKKSSAKKSAAAQAEAEEESQPLPEVNKGHQFQCHAGELLAKQTQPPKPFNDASLLSAMTGIARFVKDIKIKKILKDTDGLGTEATRAGILDLLFTRKFLCRKGRHIHATAAGRGLVLSLPESASLPDMTAEWEAGLNDIVERRLSYADFMQPMQQRLHWLIDESQRILPLALRGVTSGKSKKKYRKKKVIKQ